MRCRSDRRRTRSRSGASRINRWTVVGLSQAHFHDQPAAGHESRGRGGNQRAHRRRARPRRRRARSPARSGRRRPAARRDRASATYGGFETITSTGSLQPASRRAVPKRDAIARRPARAHCPSRRPARPREISVATTRADGLLERQRDREAAAAGADVDDDGRPTSLRVGPPACRQASASSTTSSVSGRGIRTSGVTRNGRPKNSRSPVM